MQIKGEKLQIIQIAYENVYVGYVNIFLFVAGIYITVLFIIVLGARKSSKHSPFLLSPPSAHNVVTGC